MSAVCCLLLFDVWRFLNNGRCLLLVFDCCVMFSVSWFMFVVCWLLLFVCCLLLVVVCRWLAVVCYLVVVGCCCVLCVVFGLCVDVRCVLIVVV